VLSKLLFLDTGIVKELTKANKLYG